MNILEQGLLRYLSKEQLEKIQSVKIGIGGAGGLGSNIAMILVRTGFKDFEIIDQDVIDASNLNRQQYFPDQVGSDKVEALKHYLLKINPDLRVLTHKTEWRPANGHLFFNNCDFIVEAFDQATWKQQFTYYYHDRTPYVISGVGMAGLHTKETMVIRRVGNIFIAGDGQTDSHEGHPPMAPRVVACAAMMAECVLDLTLGIRF